MSNRGTIKPEAFVASLGADLTAAEAMREVTRHGVGGAPLPPLYRAARTALRAALECGADAFPAMYAAAAVALASCVAADECAAWPKAAALASYARQAGDDGLDRLAARVEARRREAGL